ncbi:MAG: tetratricopeptide repeat protein [Muribaculaceae bacterium]|nr:tetratricopeptide repeat protein [Muribaculaceae bacterium]
MKHRIIATLLVALTTLTIIAKDIKRPESYNYQRGVELYGEKEYDQAIEYLNKELAENPKNGYASLFLGLIAVDQEHFGEAITRSQEALKRIPKKDKEYVSYAYLVLGSVYTQMGENDEAERNYAEAIALNPDNENNYAHRARYYITIKQWDKAEADYRSIVALKPGDVGGHMGLADCAMQQEHWEEAAKQLDYVLKLDPEHTPALVQRAKARTVLKRYNEASDDIIAALADYPSNNVYEVLDELADSALTTLSVKLRVRAAKEPNNTLWLNTQGLMYEYVNQPRKAIEMYQASLAKEENTGVNNRLASCYSRIGDGKKALEQINKEWEADTTDMSTLAERCSIHEMLGDFEAAITDANTLVEHAPDVPYSYILRGSIKYTHLGDLEGALEDYNTAITLAPDYKRGHFQTGRVLWDLNRRDEARQHFRRVQELDTVAEAPFEHDIFLYTFLDQPDKARQLLEEQMQKHGNDPDELYDCACAYSLLGDKQVAVDVLRQSFEKGMRHMVHVSHDPDLNNIRDMAEYKALIDEYTAILATELETGEAVDDGDYEEQVVEVPFTTEGKVCKVKCTINGLPLHFIFDTGASQVSMSNVEATFMLKNDYLSSRDVVGKANYLTANGDVSEGTVINLRDVNFGGLTLNNVQASIVRNQVAPLLLGQSVLNKLGKIEIDNTRHVLKITHRVKKNK